MKAIVTVGVSASGKTTWAKNQKGFIVISRDDVRRDILEERHNRPILPGELWKMWKWKDESVVSEKIDAKIAYFSAGGHDIILADTNLNGKYRDQLVEKLKGLGYDVEIKDFPVTLEEAWKRDSGRADGVGHDVIFKQFQQWNEYIGRKKYVVPQDKPLAVIVDIDGTLATMNGRGPFEWHRVGEDNVDPIVKTIVNGFHKDQMMVIILSGRDGVCAQETKDWLKKHDVNHHYFWMRKANDTRKDTIIKEEIFWEHIADNFNVKAVIDDRPVVVRMWMELGLKVINVGNPWIEF